MTINLRTHPDLEAPQALHDPAWGLLLLSSFVTIAWLKLNLMRPLDGPILTHDEWFTIKSVGAFSGVAFVVFFLVALQHWLRRESVTQPTPTLLSGVIVPILTIVAGGYALYFCYQELASISPYHPHLTPGESWSMWGLLLIGVTLPLLSSTTILWYIRLRRGLPVVRLA